VSCGLLNWKMLRCNKQLIFHPFEYFSFAAHITQTYRMAIYNATSVQTHLHIYEIFPLLLSICCFKIRTRISLDKVFPIKNLNFN
jgi:hypothetical protein